MFSSAARAINDIASPALRGVVWKSLALTVLLFIVLLTALELSLSWMVKLPWPWLSTLLEILTGLGLVAGFIFLLSPVTAMFAGLFLDEVADVVEAAHYPDEPPGSPLAVMPALITGIEFALLSLAVNLILLPALFFGIGAMVMWLGNAYLLGREFFGLVASRHMPPEEARRFRSDNASSVFMAGLIPAALTLVPFANFFAPLFATAYFTHYYRLVRDGRPSL